MKIKRIIVFVFFLNFLLIGSIFSGAFINSFAGRSDGNNIILTWQTNQESNCKHFVVMRGTDRNNVSDIAIVQSKGSNSSYEYVDENAYKTEGGFYVYLLKIVDHDNTVTYSGYVSIDHNVNDVKRTWGSIKALFR